MPPWPTRGTPIKYRDDSDTSKKKQSKRGWCPNCEKSLHANDMNGRSFFRVTIASFLLLLRRFGTADDADGADKMLPYPRPSASSAVKTKFAAEPPHVICLIRGHFISQSPSGARTEGANRRWSIASLRLIGQRGPLAVAEILQRGGAPLHPTHDAGDVNVAHIVDGGHFGGISGAGHGPDHAVGSGRAD